ncbi:MAG: hypothetical protein H6709_20820 [Kofleriaceae bacterium]|nr:hypothetical protein [Kofleriaceae bacterium]
MAWKTASGVASSSAKRRTSPGPARPAVGLDGWAAGDDAAASDGATKIGRGAAAPSCGARSETSSWVCSDAGEAPAKRASQRSAQPR